jgi:tungstate transport system substrate-binding protein
MIENAWLARHGLASALSVSVLVGCTRGEPSAEERRPLRLATSYSLNDSGLFAVLNRAFREETQIAIDPSFVGTGVALNMARKGQADVVLVHERSLEDVFISEGFGFNRREVFYSDYLIVGPSDDPAGIRDSTSAVEALSRIAARGAAFVSRGDGSGNHVREKSLWQLAGITPSQPWYQEKHGGMLETLKEASEHGAYALSDRPTYMMKRDQLAMGILVAGDSRLHNAYGAIAVNPLKVAGVDYDDASRFINFLAGPTATTIVRGYGKEQFGEALFFPATEADGRQ